MVVPSKTFSEFYCSHASIVGSNPTRVTAVSISFGVFLSCVCRRFGVSRSLEQWVLKNVANKIHKPGQREGLCRNMRRRLQILQAVTMQNFMCCSQLLYFLYLSPVKECVSYENEEVDCNYTSAGSLKYRKQTSILRYEASMAVPTAIPFCGQEGEL
jgi:hypothetical protein